MAATYTLQVNPDPIAAGIENPAVTSPMAGLTTKVVKGSLWTLAGQVIPLGVSLITSPIVIRLLGAEGYGVMILVLVIPGFFGFADFGMGMASTKFASEAYASDSRDREARIVRTAALISLLTSVPIAALLFFLSGTVIAWFKVPEHLLGEASLALKLAAVTIILNFLCLIFNTPQLTRLRMDLNTLVNASFRILGAISIPIVIYFGGGLVGVFAVLITVSSLTLLGHIFVSGRLLRELFQSTIEKAAIRPMLKFGGALVGATVAALLLTNLEKAVLPKLISVTELAYYSVAFTLAGMLTLFAGSMTQSLLPAFSQLQNSGNIDVLRSLFTRSLRLNLIWLIPALAGLAIIARTFFALYFGPPDYGAESVLPFNILIVGLVFNIPAHVPFTAIMASGRTDIFARIYWAELVPYGFLVWFLVRRFGAAGAAAAWSLRVFVDTLILFTLANRYVRVSIKDLNFAGFGLAAFVMLIPFVVMLAFQELNLIVLLVLFICTVVYALVVWKLILSSEEAAWLKNKILRAN